MRVLLSRAMLMLALINLGGISTYAKAANHNHDKTQVSGHCCDEDCNCHDGGECTCENCGCGEEGCDCGESGCCAGGACSEEGGCCQGGSCGQGGCSGGTCDPN